MVPYILVGCPPTTLYCIYLIYIYLDLSENTDSMFTVFYSISGGDCYFLHIHLGFSILKVKEYMKNATIQYQ